MAELADETSYVDHHKKKIAFIFSAMRHFNEELTNNGWRTEYLRYGEDSAVQSFDDLLEQALDKYRPREIIVTQANEYRVRKVFAGFSARHPGLLTEVIDDRFICSESEFIDWVAGRKQPRMEYFYRDMRRRTGLLMDGDQPIGGKWNYDADNRKTPAKDIKVVLPKRFQLDALTAEVIDTVRHAFCQNFGDIDSFWFGVKRDQANAAFEEFLQNALPLFGDYQDAMLSDEKFLFHSVISHYLNVGLLDPLDICKAVEEQFHLGRVPLNAAEGFIRQIIGWREYVRGIYWWQMPDYVELNYFGHERPLPAFYWTGETKMNCLAKCIGQTKEEAYAHHIQRLMITGNFAMLAGVQPQQIHEWYLAVYADAFEWVELPNTLGMSQFADGGLLGSKPYASGGNYINKMSDYCNQCHYKIKEKVGETACPFNYLYWHFISRHADKLQSNGRLKFAFNTWEKMSVERREQINQSAEHFLSRLR